PRDRRLVLHRARPRRLSRDLPPPRRRIYGMRTLLALGTAVVAAAAFAATAAADGLPVLGIDDGALGVASPVAPERYVTLTDQRDTIVARTSTGDGRVLGFMRLPAGNFTIPAV